MPVFWTFWNATRALATIWRTFCQPDLPRVPRDCSQTQNLDQRRALARVSCCAPAASATWTPSTQNTKGFAREPWAFSLVNSHIPELLLFSAASLANYSCSPSIRLPIRSSEVFELDFLGLIAILCQAYQIESAHINPEIKQYIQEYMNKYANLQYHGTGGFSHVTRCHCRSWGAGIPSVMTTMRRPRGWFHTPFECAAWYRYYELNFWNMFFLISV